MTVGSFGSNATRRALRDGRALVMFANVTPVGAPTVAASAFVVTKTCCPTATTTLLPFVGATDAMPGNAPRFRQVLPPSRLCQRFWFPLTYTIPAALGSVVIAAR